MRKSITIKELKEIQLNILENVDKYCEVNGLQYFLAYGTLIGAIRHKGYIPWDDDIDIYMPRPDYDIFITEYNKTNSLYKVIDKSIDANYTIAFAKVHDTRTQINETMYQKEDFGVYIDIFPLDGIENNEKAIKITRFRHYLNTKRAILGRTRTFSKNIFLAIGKICLLPFSTKYILNKMERIAREINYEKAKYVNSFFSSTAYKEIVNKNIFEDYELVKFEHLTCRIPKGYDELLKKNYGNYMELPPIEKQVSHHVFEAWWK